MLPPVESKTGMCAPLFMRCIWGDVLLIWGVFCGVGRPSPEGLRWTEAGRLPPFLEGEDDIGGSGIKVARGPEKSRWLICEGVRWTDASRLPPFVEEEIDMGESGTKVARGPERCAWLTCEGVRWTGAGRLPPLIGGESGKDPAGWKVARGPGSVA